MVYGRKPRPSWLHEVSGTSVRTQFKKKPSKLEMQKRSLRAPKDLSLNQKRIWQDIVRNSALGHLQRQDFILMRQLVVHVDLAEQYERKLNGIGHLIRTPNGLPQQSPYVGMLNRQTLIVQRLMSELGMTPCERSRLGLDSEGADDDDGSEYFD